MNKILLGLLLGALLGAIDGARLGSPRGPLGNGGNHRGIDNQGADCRSGSGHLCPQGKFGATRNLVRAGGGFRAGIPGRIYAAWLLLRNHSSWEHRGDDRGICHAAIRNGAGNCAVGLVGEDRRAACRSHIPVHAEKSATEDRRVSPRAFRRFSDRRWDSAQLS